VVHPDDREMVFDLVEEARGGDRVALGQLYDLYAERIFRFALARTRHAADAEDVVSDVFVIAFSAIDRYRWTGAPFSSWLFGVAHNILRRHAPRPGVVSVERAVEATAEDDAFRTFEGRHDMLRQLRRLKPQHQQVLMMRFYGSMTAEEVAQATGSNANAVRQAQFEAIRHMRRLMDQEKAA
jgi:RNA polymerase sigma-70 factor (ECF subfamily)